jgi:2-dehydro-3-deoxygluconokinase
MGDKKPPVVCVGDVAIEFTRGADGRFASGCGGDAFNTAVFLARAGLPVSFATALGDDSYSDSIVAMAAAENVATDLVLRVPGRLPGLHLVDPAAGTGRRLLRWDAGAPAGELFETEHWDHVAAGLLTARLVYFSGITLSLFSNLGIGRFLAVLEVARKAGTVIAFDCNFRPHGWKGDLGRARTVFIETLKRVDIALPAFDDEAVLWGDPSPETTVERMQAFGIAEVAVKNGPASALVAASGERQHVPVPEAIEPSDMLAAGDAFNAGYLAARLQGEKPPEAALAAHRLAGEVIRHKGDILPRAGAAVH